MLDVAKRQNTAPFDTERLDRLMDDAGMDVLLVTSKHNVQYLLGGHRAFFTPKANRTKRASSATAWRTTRTR